MLVRARSMPPAPAENSCVLPIWSPCSPTFEPVRRILGFEGFLRSQVNDQSSRLGRTCRIRLFRQKKFQLSRVRAEFGLQQLVAPRPVLHRGSAILRRGPSSILWL